MKRVKVAYYSGTGGTARIAQCFSNEFAQQGFEVDLERIRSGDGHTDALNEYDLLVLVTVVHDFCIPHQVLLWIDTIECSHRLETAVFSVSGGGEVLPNRAARKKPIKMLEGRGITVNYEDMFIMPCNYMFKTNDVVAAMEMAAYPALTADATKRIIAGEKRRTKVPKIDSLVAKAMQNAWKRGRKFGRSIEVLDSCNGCALCVKTCHASNISIDKNTEKPIFSNHCTVCLACFYACPQSALKPGREKYAVLKDGFNLDQLQPLPISHEDWGRVDVLCRGILWSGLNPYLSRARSLLVDQENQKTAD
jgi:Flavodoxins